MKICIDPGHHVSVKGKRSPQVPPGIIEWEFDMSVALCLEELLIESGHDAFRTMQISEPKNKTLKARAAMGADADMNISIHANAARGVGWSKANGFVVRYKRWSGRSMAKAIAASIRKNIPEIKPRFGGYIFDPIRTGAITGKKPSCLVECGFMTNKIEASILADPQTPKRFARAIAEAVLAEFERKTK
jgi:N-acetylmuramoyl-L-alanine amidase